MIGRIRLVQRLLRVPLQPDQDFEGRSPETLIAQAVALRCELMRRPLPGSALRVDLIA